MTLIYIDSCSDRSAVTAAGASPASWLSIGTNNVTGRDGASRGAIGSVINGGTALYPATPANDLILGCALNWTAITSTNVQIAIYDSGSVQQASLNFDGTGHLTYRRGTSASAVIATSTQVLTPGVWNYWEIQLVVDDTTGTMRVKVDGVDWINFTGDTRAVGTANVARYSFNRPNAVGSDIYIDDVYLLSTSAGSPYNTFQGDVGVQRLYPNGNGASSQFVGSDGNSTDNYLLVDEVTFDAADFVDGSTATDKDLYDMASLSYSAGTVHAVSAVTAIAKADAGTRSFKQLDKQSSTRTGSSTALSVTPQEFTSAPLMTDADSNAWTVARVNSMQVGVEVA